MMTTAWTQGLSRVLNEAALRRVALGVTALLVIGLAYSLAQLTWRLWPAPAAASGPAAVAAGHTPAPARAAAKPVGADLAALHLFGQFDAASQAGATQPAVLPETPLNLILHGVIASDDRANARAIIADASGKENYYALDAELPGGAVLKEIHADHVVLARNNQNEVLRLPKNAGADNPANAVASPPLPTPNLPTAPGTAMGETDLSDAEFGTPEVAEPPQPDGAPPVDGTPPPDAATVANAAAQDDVGALLRNYRDALAANPQSLVGLAQTEPVQAGGRFLGYRVQPGSDPMLFQRLGLEPGDIVTSVNGISLDNPASGATALNAMARGSELRLIITRNGTPKTLAFAIP